METTEETQVSNASVSSEGKFYFIANSFAITFNDLC